jgi:antitoxin component HigA of HigAB toxin-antitoxin module
MTKRRPDEVSAARLRAAAGRIAERVREDPEAIARLAGYLEEQTAQEEAGSIHAELRRIIEQCGLSLGELARRAGVEPDELSRFLLGEQELTTEILGRLTEELELEIRNRARQPPGSTQGKGEDR